jgi:hypothetical protein
VSAPVVSGRDACRRPLSVSRLHFLHNSDSPSRRIPETTKPGFVSKPGFFTCLQIRKPSDRSRCHLDRRVVSNRKPVVGWVLKNRHRQPWNARK